MAAPLVKEERDALAPRMFFTRLFALPHTRESPRRLGELNLTGLPVAFRIGADRSPRILRDCLVHKCMDMICANYRLDPPFINCGKYIYARRAYGS